jgi:hypothetical protein
MKLHPSSLMLHRFSLGSLIGLLCLQLAAMGGAPSPKTITQHVSAAQGGTVTSPSGGLTLSIPPGALAKDTDITIEELAPGEGLVLGPTYDLGPTSLKFQKPATLTLHFKPADIPEGYEKEDVAITEVKPQGISGAPDAAGSAQSDPIITAGLNFLESEVNVAAGTVIARIEHFSRYSARAYISYTLGWGKRILINPYDYCLKGAKSGGSGYAEATASVAHGGEFFQKVGAKVGVSGVGAAVITMGIYFRVKAGKKGQKSTTGGQLVVNIDHGAVLSADCYHIAFMVSFIDFSGQPGGKANFPIQDLNSGLKVLPGHATQCYFANPMAPPSMESILGPPYKPGTFSVWFDRGEWQAGRFYAVFISLITSVWGTPATKHFPAMGGEVRWNGPFAPGQCLTRAIQIED